MRRGRRLVLVLFVLAVPVAVVAGLAIVDLLRVRADIERARDDLTNIRIDAIEHGDDLKALAASADARLQRAAHRASTSRWLKLARKVPVVADQVEGVEDLANAAAAVGEIATDAADRLGPVLDAADESPANRVALLDAAAAEIERIVEQLETIDPGDGPLLPPLAGARDSFEESLRKATDKLVDSQPKVAALRNFFAGPTRYLVLAANNAEMTAGSGMTNAGGIIRIRGGEMAIRQFVSADKVWLGKRGISPPGDLFDLYWFTGIGTDFRGSTASPNFPVIGRMLADMSAQTPLKAVQGVFVIDAIALREIMMLTGPVTIDGIKYSARNVVQEVLNENYIRFPSVEVRSDREELQGRIATAVFDELRNQAVSPARVAGALERAAQGRHFLAWSKDPNLQALWSSFGAAGELPPDGLMISAENFDANKLDYYLRPIARLDARRRADGAWTVNIAVSIRNSREFTDAPYVLGKTPRDHFVLLDFHLPRDATDIRMVRGDPLSPGYPEPRLGDDPPLKVINMIYRVSWGEERTIEIEFTLPESQTELQLLPSARVRPLVLDVGGRRYNDLVTRTIELPDGLVDVRDRPADLFALVLAGGGVLFTVSAIVGGPVGAPGERRPRSGRRFQRAEFDARAAAVFIVAAGIALAAQSIF